MFNRWKHRVEKLEEEIKQLKSNKVDCHTETILDYLIGDDVNCPICNAKMNLNTVKYETKYCPQHVYHQLICPRDKFTVNGYSLKECVDKLKTITVLKSEE